MNYIVQLIIMYRFLLTNIPVSHRPYAKISSLISLTCCYFTVNYQRLLTLISVDSPDSRQYFDTNLANFTLSWVICTVKLKMIVQKFCSVGFAWTFDIYSTVYRNRVTSRGYRQ
jgi:hypothetical protein